MRLTELVKSKGYVEASEKVGRWTRALETADALSARRIRDEKAAYFSRMKAETPSLYAAFQMDDKALSEIIQRKLTGEDSVID